MISSFQLLENDNSNNAMNSISEKDYSKYINLTKDEIVQKINAKNKEIINYHNINKSLKTELTGILEKLNSFTKKNFLQLNQTENNLQAVLNNKKIEYIKNKTDNSMLKAEFNKVSKRMKEISDKKIANIIYEKKLSIEKIKEENFEINKEINKEQSESAQTQNKVMKIRNNELYLKNLDLFSYKLKKYLDEKNRYIKSFNMVNRILKEKVKEVDNLENEIKIKNKPNSKNEMVFNKLKEELNKIKVELNNVIDEVDKKNINEDILILNNIFQKNEDTTKNETININNILNIKNKILPGIFITKSPSPKNVHHKKKLNFNHNRNYNSIIINNEKFKPMLKKNNSLSILKNDENYKSIDNQSRVHKNLIKFNFRLSGKNIANNNPSSTSSTLNISDKKGKFFIKKINHLSYDFNKIKCNEITDEDYKNLLDKKENYLEESERISKNIQDINKSFLSKYTKSMSNFKKNINKLNEIKIINNGLQTEIKKLQDLMIQIQEEAKKIKENEVSLKDK